MLNTPLTTSARRPVLTAIAALNILALAYPSATYGQTPWMSEEGMRTAFTGKTISGQYASGRTFVEKFEENGALEYRETGHNRTGHWSLTAGLFCTIYVGDPTGGCYRVTRVSQNCFEFYFAARTERQARANDLRKPGWTARAWIQSATSTCNTHPTV